MNGLLPAARIGFAALLVLTALDHFAGPFLFAVQGSTPLAAQFADAVRHSGLLDVTMAIQIAAGLLILARFAVPAALCVMMPISTCAAYWAVLLERDPVWALVALLALALNGALMLAHLDRYRGMLHAHALALGEEAKPGRNYETLFAWPLGRIAPVDVLLGLFALLAAAGFYFFIVPPLFSDWALPVLLFPAAVLAIRGVQSARAR